MKNKKVKILIICLICLQILCAVGFTAFVVSWYYSILTPYHTVAEDFFFESEEIQQQLGTVLYARKQAFRSDVKEGDTVSRYYVVHVEDREEPYHVLVTLKKDGDHWSVVQYRVEETD